MSKKQKAPTFDLRPKKLAFFVRMLFRGGLPKSWKDPNLSKGATK